MENAIEKFRRMNQGLYDESRAKRRKGYYDHRRKDLSRAKQQERAKNRVYYAVRTGKIKRPGECLLCERAVKPVAHHWNGYDNPLDVWWVCQGCNTLLRNHDGSMTLDQARYFMAHRFDIK